MKESHNKPPSALSRRQFVTACSSVCIPAVLPALQGCSTSPDDLVQAIVEYFSYLKLDSQGVSKFVSTYQEVTGGKQPNLEEFFLKYLLSTDFFAHQQDESRVIMFTSYYDPEHFVCNNPFAVLS